MSTTKYDALWSEARAKTHARFGFASKAEADRGWDAAIAKVNAGLPSLAVVPATRPAANQMEPTSGAATSSRVSSRSDLRKTIRRATRGRK